MGQIKNLVVEAFDLVSETIDLFPSRVDVRLSDTKIFLTFENGQECVIKIVLDKINENTLTTKDSDEYELADEIERVIRNGNNELFLCVA